MRGLLYIVVLIAVCGCVGSGGRNGELDEAQRLLTSDPGAAYRKLNAIDVSDFRDSATMARWALLYSEAMVANRIAAPTDTIVNIALDYYGGHDARDEFQRASGLKSLMSAQAGDNELATALYLQKEKEFMLYRERARREQMAFVVALVILAAVGTIVWMRQRLKLKKAQNEALMAEASGLKCRIEMNANDMGRMEAALRGMLTERFALIDSLCQTYYETQGSPTERKAIAEKVKSEIEAVRTDSFAEMERTVNDCRDNLLQRVKAAYPDIKPDDYRLATYLASGLSARTISLLMGETVEVIYKRKSRLKKRLQERFKSAESSILDIF